MDFLRICSVTTQVWHCGVFALELRWHRYMKFWTIMSFTGLLPRAVLLYLLLCFSINLITLKYVKYFGSRLNWYLQCRFNNGPLESFRNQLLCHHLLQFRWLTNTSWWLLGERLLLSHRVFHWILKWAKMVMARPLHATGRLVKSIF